MPRIWTDTIDGHRRQVADTVLDATRDLVQERGPVSVTMAAVAERAGVSRATLYKYFPDVEAILVAWHRREVGVHLRHLESLADQDVVTLDDLAGFVRRQRRHRGAGSAAERFADLAHSVAGLALKQEKDAHEEVLTALTALVARLAGAGQVRRDLRPAVLAQWLFHAIHAPELLDEHAVATLVTDSLAAGPDQVDRGARGGRRPGVAG